MNDPDAYIMLISSLPRPEALFGSKRPPLSRLKLDRRLRVLVPEHAEQLRLVEQLLTWSALPITVSEEQVAMKARAAVQTIDNETLCAIIRDRLEIRTCMAALRRRHRGESAPSKYTVWGYGRWISHIRHNWREAGFRLDRVFPWLREADRLLKTGDSLALERLLLEQVWKNISRHSDEHRFDFEAVVVYVLQWDIVDRWVRHSSEQATGRFREMTGSALGEYADLFAAER